MLGGEVYVAVATGEAHDKPFLLLAAVAPTPYPSGELDGQIVSQPAPALRHNLGVAGADLLLQFPERCLARGLARVYPALRHLPRRHIRHIDAAGDEHLALAVQQHNTDSRTVAEQLEIRVCFCHRDMAEAAPVGVILVDEATVEHCD